MEDNAKDVLIQYMIKNEGFLPNKGELFTNPKEEIVLPVIDGFIWEWHNNVDSGEESIVDSIWAVSTDSSKVFVYNKATDDWIESKRSITG